LCGTVIPAKAAMTAHPLAGGDVHRDFEAEAEVTSGRGFPFHVDSLRYGLNVRRQLLPVVRRFQLCGGLD
jgi:hypothetical protein